MQWPERIFDCHSHWGTEKGHVFQTPEERANQPKKLRPLTDGYVREVLSSRSILHRSEIPPALVAIQKDHLQLKRELNNRNK